MLGEGQFYHSTIKNSIVAFANVFGDLQIKNLDKVKNVVRAVVCPLSYAAKQQWFTRLQTDPDFKKKFETELPRMSFEVVNYAYNPSKKLGNYQNQYYKSAGNDQQVVGDPVPYRLTIALYSYTKTQEDALQILEQILPFFAPSVTVNISLLPEMGISMDFPIILTGVHTEDNYDDKDSNRMIIQTFNFDMDVQLFGPVDQGAVIKEVDVKVNTRTQQSGQFSGAEFNAKVVPRDATKTDKYTIESLWKDPF